jgi:fructose-bisphosphate aldolase, class II
MSDTAQIVQRANELGLTVPSFNTPYLPVMEPVVRALVDQDCFGLIAVARPEWIKFEAKSLAAIASEYAKCGQPSHTRLHLDHVPVIDEDHLQVEYMAILQEAIDLGYQSVMVDGSRLDLLGNIAATREAVELAHSAGVPCEAELGAVMGHETGPLPPYEELYASGKGFTDVTEAARFVSETHCDWLSVAIGNIHGAISGVARDQKKLEARLNLDHLEQLHRATGIPLVLHGGSGIKQEYLLGAVKRGIAKVNIGTEIRQAYESTMRDTGNVAAAQAAVYERACWMLRDYFGLAGTARRLTSSPS